MPRRATVTLETDTGEIVAIGDHPSQKKEAERLAALNALYQLDAQGLVLILYHVHSRLLIADLSLARFEEG